MIDIATQNSAYYVRQAHFDTGRMAGTVAHWKNNDGGSVDASPVNALSVSGLSQKTNVVAPTMSFGEVLDVVNPLHHLPVVGGMYRNMTGDTISPVAKIFGNTLYSGGLGGLSSIATAAIEEHSGKDVMTALVDSAKVETPKYALHEDSRTAGMNKQVKESVIEDVIVEQPPVEIAAAVVTPPQKPFVSDNDDIFKRLESEKREPVTPVLIDIAVAKVRNDWGNLNG